MGAFRETSASSVDEFEQWLGCPVEYVVDYPARATWQDIENPNYLLREWQGQQRRLVLALAMLPQDEPGVSQAAGADGAYDEHFRALASRLVDSGHGDAVIRLGWEFNLRESPSFTEDQEAFRDYWRRIVETMRSVPGTRFAFDWTVNNGTSPVDATAYYPGDDVVDVVGVDTYDVAGKVYPYPRSCDDACRTRVQALAWSTSVYGGERGLRFWRQFAVDHGKQLSLPEWGLWKRPDGTGGGDDPDFIRRMHAFITDPKTPLAYQAYFEYDGQDGQHRLMTTFDEAGEVFRELFTTPLPTPEKTTGTTS